MIDEKLKSLTDRIYVEGVEKAQKEALEIVNAAKTEAKAILDQAHLEALSISQLALKERTELKRKVESELKLTVRQSIDQLKIDIANLINFNISSRHFNDAMSDKEFVQKLILALVDSWAAKGREESFKIELPKTDQEELKDFLHQKCQRALKEGLEIAFSDRVHSGFHIKPKDESYVIEFSEDSFQSFFKGYIRPITQSLLF